MGFEAAQLPSDGWVSVNSAVAAADPTTPDKDGWMSIPESSPQADPDKDGWVSVPSSVEKPKTEEEQNADLLFGGSPAKPGEA